MAKTLVRRGSSVSTPLPSVELDESASFDIEAGTPGDAERAANEEQVLEQRRVNPLWMISWALAMVFGLGALLLIA